MTKDLEGLTLCGLKIIVNDYVPDNCVVVNVAMYKKLLKDMENDSSTQGVSARSNK